MHRTRTTMVVASLAAAATLGVTVAATAGIGSPATSVKRVDVGFTEDRSADLAAAIDPAKPRNVILIIGDGMDDSIITAARNYELGADGRFSALDNLPFTGAMTTHGLKVGADATDYPKAYVSDSAPTASGWSTGKKTVDGRISQGPSAAANIPGENYQTVLEQYQLEGKLVGNISTAEITDATPAAAASHISQRGCQGPTDMTNCATETKAAGGLGSIAEQLVDHEIDVLMGGGKNRYNQTLTTGGTALDYATGTKGYRLVEDEASMNAITSLEGGPVLGLFTGGNMTPRYNPLVAAAPPGTGSATTKCTEATRGNQPDFAEMTAKAIELLDNEEGFFLQAESAMIDKQEHSSDICGAIGDVAALNDAVQVALDYQVENPDTLIVVTGDHSHSTQIVSSVNDGRQTATVQTADGDPMYVAYSTAASGSNHTGTQIRVAASGPQGSNVTGVIDQTDLFQTLLGRTPSELPPGEPAPAEPLKPSTRIASLNKIAATDVRRTGLPISVAASGANSVKVTVRNKGRVLSTKTLSNGGGTFSQRAAKLLTGTLVINVAVSGPGGSTSATKTVTLTR